VIISALTRLSSNPVTTQSTVLKTVDGAADVYGLDTADKGIMVNHASGMAIWDVLFTTASEADLTIFAPGSPACIPRSDLLQHLPDELRHDAQVIASGRELSQRINR
jgi:hypothetical protein